MDPTREEGAVSYAQENEAKAHFDDVYTAPTPHAYIATMAQVGYEIGEQARPYCQAAARLLQAVNGDVWPVHMLDIGCSYGIGTAFVRNGCSFDEMVAFFGTRAPTEYAACCSATRVWLNATPPQCDVRAVGLDSSAPAIRFAVDAGLLDKGCAHDLEEPGTAPTPSERSWFRSCNLVMCVGAIGYVGARTFESVLDELGKDHPGAFGPAAVMTVLRMFDAEPVAGAFEERGYRCGPVPGVRLPQRRFRDAEERDQVLGVLQRRGIEVEGFETRGRLLADLYIAARPERFDELGGALVAAHEERSRVESNYIQRWGPDLAALGCACPDRAKPPR